MDLNAISPQKLGPLGLKTLVVYYSRTGHTRTLALELARLLNADIEEIQSATHYPRGFWGHQRALIHSSFHFKPEIKRIQKHPGEYDLVLVGGPIWGGNIAAPVRSFLLKYKYDLGNVAFFLTQGGRLGRENSFEQMHLCTGRDSLGNLAVSERELKDETFKSRAQVFVAEISEQKRKSEPSGRLWTLPAPGPG